MKYKANVLYSMDLLQNENGHVNNNEPFVNRNQSWPGDTQNNAKLRHKNLLGAFRHESPKETQATERLFKGAHLSTLTSQNPALPF